MSSIEDAKQGLQNILNSHSPSSIINKGFVTIFHSFFDRCSPEEAVQFLPPGFLSKLQSFQLKKPHVCPRPFPQSQEIPSTPDVLHNMSNLGRMIVAGGQNPPFCEPSASIPCLQSRPRHDKQAIDVTFFTPESFKKQDRQDIQPSVNASKLIRCIEEVARRGLREPEFYGALWDNWKDIQPHSHITDPLHRYGALQQMINVSAETEVKYIYRQRIAHILGAHELEVINRSISDSELQGLHRKSLVVGKLSKSLGKTRKEIHQHNTKRRHYLSFYFKIGPGAIPLLGDSGNKEMLEKTLTDGEVTYVLEYIQNSLPDWLSLCTRINFEVATSILKGLQITGWDGRSYCETDFMSHLGKFIDLDMFQKFGEFRPVSGEESSSKRKSRGSPLKTPAETQSDGIFDGQSNRARKKRRTGHEADSIFSTSETSADFESRQDSIRQIPNPGNLPCDESAMPQKQVQQHLRSHEQGGSPRHFLRQTAPSSASVYPTEKNAARTSSAARSDHGGQTCFLHDPCASNLMVGEPGTSSRGLCEMGISDDFSLLAPPSNDVQFNPYDILDPPFNDVQFNPYDILDSPFSDVQFNPYDILDPPFSDVQFNPYDILDPPFNDAQFASDNTSQGWPQSEHFEPRRQVSCALEISA